MKKLICINKKDCSWLTIGKEYICQEENETTFSIMNDDNFVFPYKKSHFNWNFVTINGVQMEIPDNLVEEIKKMVEPKQLTSSEDVKQSAKVLRTAARVIAPEVASGFMEVRACGNLTNRGFFISGHYNTKWEIVTDNDGCQVLIPVKS